MKIAKISLLIAADIEDVSDDDRMYKIIEFDIDIDYVGTEISDVLTVSGTIADTLDSEDWK